MTAIAQLPKIAARLERNLALISGIGTWGINSVPIGTFTNLAPRLLIAADRENSDATVKKFIANCKLHGAYPGIWFGVPDASETVLAYGERVVTKTRSLTGTDGSVEVMLDLEANWDRQKIIDAVTAVVLGHVGVNPGDPAWIGLTRLLTVTCEPQQDWSVFPWQELAALGVSAVYIQCYGAKKTDRRDPLYCTAVAMGSGAPHRMVKCLVLAGMPSAQVMGHDKDGKPAPVGTYAQRLPLTGALGHGFYLANDWGQTVVNPAVFEADVATYAPLIGGVLPLEGERRKPVVAYR